MTVFREGDVVWRLGDPERRRVTYVACREPDAHVEIVDGTSKTGRLWVNATTLTLDRRPVRDGDPIVAPGRVWTVTASDVEAGHRFDGWTHADGTEIDRPAAADMPGEWRPRAPIIIEKASARPQEPGLKVAVPCQCGRTTIHPLGTQDPKEGRCEHVMRLDRMRGRTGMMVCTGCSLAIGVDVLLDQGVEPSARYGNDGNKLADEAQRVRDENTSLLVENAKLRRELEAKARRR